MAVLACALSVVVPEAVRLPGTIEGKCVSCGRSVVVSPWGKFAMAAMGARIMCLECVEKDPELKAAPTMHNLTDEAEVKHRRNQFERRN